MSGIEYRIGDVFDRLAEIPDGSIDLIVTSPPFLALRSYLPADHPDKHKEIGSEPTPAEFLDTMLALSAEFARVLAPHGSLCVELGDTYSGSGGAGGDYADGGMRDMQPRFAGSGSKHRMESARAGTNSRLAAGAGWPLAKSMTGIPTLFTWSLAYGRNLLTGAESPAGMWRIRNLICWARPNPPVGALGDKFRPATSYITVACKSAKRYFDLDAVRVPYSLNTNARTAQGVESRVNDVKTSPDGNRDTLAIKNNDGQGAPPLDWLAEDHPEDGDGQGAPPLDWLAEDHPEDGDWLWKLSTQPYAGSHYATFPLTLPKRLIEAMCPQKVCTSCGVPSTRIAETTNSIGEATGRKAWRHDPTIGGGHTGDITLSSSSAPTAERVTLGWTDCGHATWRTGVVLDPFAGSGTTLEAAQLVGRSGIGIDLDDRNAHLAVERVGMFLEIVA